MPASIERAQLPELLHFKPWWPIWDPVPDWWFNRLDKVQVRRLAVVQLELTKSLLEAQLKANNQALEIAKGVK